MEMNQQMNNHSYEDEEVIDDLSSITNVNHEPDTDSSDELSNVTLDRVDAHLVTHDNDNDDEDIKEYDDDDNDEEQDEQETSNQDDQQTDEAHQSQQFQQNCLAAAQMIQLMSSGSVQQQHLQLHQASYSPSNNNNQNNTGVSELNEKENIPICKFCQKVFANFSNLNHHVSAIHLNQSKWVCSQCGKICSSKSNLKVHLRVHLRVKPYHCRWCTYSCMHHSSIRDHLAKVHPDKTHTPLQPGYLFNSQAVPEPEVFNAKGFNVNTFVTDSKLKRSSREMEQQQQHTIISPDHTAGKQQRVSKKSRLMTEASQQQQHQQQQHQHVSKSPNQLTNSSVSNSSAEQSNGQSTPMSNLYNAYAMARMFNPFMYNPMQYAAAAAAQHQQHQLSPSALLNLLQQNQQAIQQSHHTQSYSSYPNTSSSSSSSSSHSADEHTSSNLSYSNSSRSSSLSPRATNAKNTPTASTATATDDTLFIKSEPIVRNYTVNKNIFSVDQMLSNTKVSRETQTDQSMFQPQQHCSMCSHCNKNY